MVLLMQIKNPSCKAIRQLVGKHCFHNFNFIKSQVLISLSLVYFSSSLISLHFPTAATIAAEVLLVSAYQRIPLVLTVLMFIWYNSPSLLGNLKLQYELQIKIYRYLIWEEKGKRTSKIVFLLFPSLLIWFFYNYSICRVYCLRKLPNTWCILQSAKS